MLLSALMLPATAHLLDIDDYGARRNDSSEPAIRANIKAFNLALADAKPSDTVLISAGKSAYTFRGSILATNLFNVSLQIDGNIVLDDTIKAWPAPSSGMRPPPWFYLFNSSHIIVSGAGEIDGQGLRWWDASITGSVAGLGERRPNIFLFDHVSDLLLERLTLRNSPHFHVKFNQCARVIVRYLTIDVDRFAQRRLKARAHAQRLTSAGLLNHSAATALTQRLYSSGNFYGVDALVHGAQGRPGEHERPGEHGTLGGLLDWLFDQAVKLLPAWALQPEDLNTDGIDPNGIDFHVHDCIISNDDDSIAVKPSDGKGDVASCSRNMLFENLVLTGCAHAALSARAHSAQAHFHVFSAAHRFATPANTHTQVRRVDWVGPAETGHCLRAQHYLSQHLDARHRQGDLHQVQPIVRSRL